MDSTVDIRPISCVEANKPFLFDASTFLFSPFQPFFVSFFSSKRGGSASLFESSITHEVVPIGHENGAVKEIQYIMQALYWITHSSAWTWIFMNNTNSRTYKIILESLLIHDVNTESAPRDETWGRGAERGYHALPPPSFPFGNDPRGMYYFMHSRTTSFYRPTYSLPSPLSPLPYPQAMRISRKETPKCRVRSYR